MGFDWKRTLATVAPTIATALGGPMAGVAVNVAAKALGVESDESAVSAVVASGDPEILLKLKQAELDFEAQMKQLDVDVAKINAADRDSARNLAIKTSIKPQIAIAIVFVIIYGLLVYSLFSGTANLDTAFLALAANLIGILTGGFTQILNFFYGSSSGSKDKTTLMGTKK